MNLYLDTSALIKLYHAEAGTENLVALLDKYAEDLVLTISDIAMIEFYSAFLKRVRKKEITLKKTQNVFSLFEDDIYMFNLIEVDNIVKSTAVELLKKESATLGLTTLDSIQLAAAITAHNLFPVDMFVTSDIKLLNIAEKYFLTYNPE
jgi:uncharacterized protein